MTTKQVIKKIGLLPFLKSRIVTPKEFMRAWMNENMHVFGAKWSFKEILFFARYEACKAIEGYDFV